MHATLEMIDGVNKKCREKGLPVVVTGKELEAVQIRQAERERFQADSVHCRECGDRAYPSGCGYTCRTCGVSSGCG